MTENRPALRLEYGFEDWTTATHLERALGPLADLEVAPSRNAGDTLSETDDDAPLLWVESGVDHVPDVDTVLGRAARHVPVTVWLIDTHRAWRWRFAVARSVDHTWVTQRDAAERLRAAGVPARWLPLAAPGDLADRGAALDDRPFDVAFVGQVHPRSDRAAILAALEQRFRVRRTQARVTPAEMMEVYRSARVVVNIPWKDDLNMRAFEAAAAGAVLLTGRMTGADDVLLEGTYRSVPTREPADWSDAVTRALAWAEAQHAVDAAYAHVLEHHTYDARARVIVEDLEELGSRTLVPQARVAGLVAAHVHYGHVRHVARLPSMPGTSRLAATAAAAAYGAARAVKQRRR